MKKSESKINKEPINATCEPQPMNFVGLRNILFEELNLLRANKISVARARVTSQIARRIIEASTLDLYARGQLGPMTEENAKRLMSNNVQG